MDMIDDEATSLSRRTALAAPLALAVGSMTVACSAQGQGVTANGSRTLVAYFSRSGNTRVIAGQLQRTLRADLLEILPAAPYPPDYLETVEQARKERDAGFEPALQADGIDISHYDTLFLGFPIWGETAPPVIRSFLRKHDLSGKSVRPFITHGGYGLGSSLAVLRSHAPRASLAEPFLLEADQERRTMNAVNAWLDTIQPAPAVGESS